MAGTIINGRRRLPSQPCSISSGPPDPRATCPFHPPTTVCQYHARLRLRALGLELGHFQIAYGVAPPPRYRVLENCAFNAPPGENVWHRTLEVRTEHAGKAEPLLSIWQKCDDDPDRFCMVEERARENLSPPVRRWIDMAQRLAEMRGG